MSVSVWREMRRCWKRMETMYLILKNRNGRYLYSRITTILIACFSFYTDLFNISWWLHRHSKRRFTYTLIMNLIVMVLSRLTQLYYGFIHVRPNSLLFSLLPTYSQTWNTLPEKWKWQILPQIDYRKSTVGKIC